MKQITVFSQSRKDLITDITKLLAEKEINLKAMVGRNFGESSIVTLTISEFERALEELQKCDDLQVICEDAIIVKVNDEVGALARLTKRFSDEGIIINSIRFIERHEEHALVAISSERNDKTLSLVEDIRVH